MKRAVAAALVAGAVVWAAPARAELRVLFEGYSVSLIGTEWAHGGEQYFGGGPQTDGLGNVYLIEGGAPGRRIVRATCDSLTNFAELRGHAEAYIMGLWFDGATTMIVLVQRAAPTTHGPAGGAAGPIQLAAWPNGEMGRERVFYRIKGFPRPGIGGFRDAAAVGSGVPLLSYVAGAPPRARRALLGVAMVLLLSTAAAVMLRQFERDATHFWRRR